LLSIGTSILGVLTITLDCFVPPINWNNINAAVIFLTYLSLLFRYLTFAVWWFIILSGTSRWLCTIATSCLRPPTTILISLKQTVIFFPEFLHIVAFCVNSLSVLSSKILKNWSMSP